MCSDQSQSRTTRTSVSCILCGVILHLHELTAVPPCRLQRFRCLAARVPAVGVSELRRRRPFQHPGIVAVLGMAGRRRRDGAGQARAAPVADGCCSRCRQPTVNSSLHPDVFRELVHCCSSTCFAASCCAKSLPVPAANARFHIRSPPGRLRNMIVRMSLAASRRCLHYRFPEPPSRFRSCA